MCSPSTVNADVQRGNFREHSVLIARLLNKITHSVQHQPAIDHFGDLEGFDIERESLHKSCAYRPSQIPPNLFLRVALEGDVGPVSPKCAVVLAPDDDEIAILSDDGHEFTRAEL